MSKQGLEVVARYGDDLPLFASLDDARNFYFAFRDRHLSIWARIAVEQDKFVADFSPESLKQVEAWYFDLWENELFDTYKVDRPTFERCMAMYFCEMVVRNFQDATWVVEEFVFSTGKYELGVRRQLCTYMILRFTDHYKEPNNKRRQSIYRLFNKYFGRT